METTAAGPIAISLELPIRGYIRGGTILVSEWEQEQINCEIPKKWRFIKKNWKLAYTGHIQDQLVLNEHILCSATFK